VGLFGPLGDSALSLESSLGTISRKVPRLPTLEAYRTVRGGSGWLRVSALGGPSSHRASSPQRSPRTVQVHGDWDVCVRWWGCGRVVLRGFCILSPVHILVSAVAPVLLVRVLEPTSLVIALFSSLLLGSPRSKDILYHLARFNALDSLLFGGLVSVRDRRSKNVFNYTPWKTFYEKLDGLRIAKVITGDSGEAFEVVRVLADLGPL